MAMTVTQIATAMAGLTWMFVEWALNGEATLVGFAPVRSPASSPSRRQRGFVGPGGAWSSGSSRAWCAIRGDRVKALFGYDDALDCFGVHAFGGIAGALLTGVFAVAEYGGTAGALEGNVQVRSSISESASSSSSSMMSSSSLIILTLIEVFVGLRVSEDTRARRTRSRLARRSGTVTRSEEACRGRPPRQKSLTGRVEAIQEGART